MRHLPPSGDERVLVGYATADDAGVFKIRDDLALVQTVDFFTPIVDDPHDYGRIAAANSLSDIYAMGGVPITALNIAAFPSERLPLSVLERILAGGAEIAKQAGVAILGGHTIKDAEPKYGMAVTGTIDPRSIVTNGNARPGDSLILTKPLGTGVLSTALKKGMRSAEDLHQAIEWMATLNDMASRAMLQAKVHAATDITGYGLLGHAGEMARASHVALRIEAASVPLLPGVLTLIEQGAVPGGTTQNAHEHARFTSFGANVPREMRLAFSDAQTSGGLLIALPPEEVGMFRSELRGARALAAVIGEVQGGEGITIE